MRKPYFEKNLNENLTLRGFVKSTPRSALVWHRDAEDRTIIVVEGVGWKFQRDNRLPHDMNPGDRIRVSAGEYHRVIKGESDLIVAIVKEAKDQNDDGKNDFEDVKIARMKASGMSDAEIKEKYPGLYEEEFGEAHCTGASESHCNEESVRENKKSGHPTQYGAPEGSKRDKQLDQTKKDLKRAKELRKDGKAKQAKELEQRAYKRRETMEKQARQAESKSIRITDPDILREYLEEIVEEQKLYAALEEAYAIEEAENEEFESLLELLSIEEAGNLDEKRKKKKKKKKKKKRAGSTLSKAVKKSLDKKADRRCLTRGSVYAEFRAGLGAYYSSGSRKGMSAHQWAHARVNSANPSKSWAKVKEKKEVPEEEEEMKLSKRALTRLIETFLHEKQYSVYKCPRCGHEHESKPAGKCENCGYKYGENWHTKKESLFKALYEQAKEYVCPPATQDVDLNTENRNATREDHAYGPMNPLQPSEGYWEEMANNWKGATVEEAAGMRCGNCIAFDISPRMRDCMPISQEQYAPEDMEGEEIDPMDMADMQMAGKTADDFPMMPEEAYVGFGYCWMHHFKCHSARSCDTWAGGGPLATDEDSHKWQDKNTF